MAKLWATVAKELLLLFRDRAGLLVLFLMPAALVVVISLVPFVCGLVLGIAVGFVGSSYPIVVGLLSGMTMGEALPYFCLAYIMGYMGMMLSPVHLCLVITNQYFKANLAKAYLYLVPLALFSGLCGTGLFFLYRAIM